MLNGKRNMRKRFICSVICLIGLFVSTFFMYSMKMDYESSNKYVKGIYTKELEKILSDEQSIGNDRAAVLIRGALDREYDEFVILIFYTNLMFFHICLIIGIIYYLIKNKGYVGFKCCCANKQDA